MNKTYKMSSALYLLMVLALILSVNEVVTAKQELKLALIYQRTALEAQAIRLELSRNQSLLFKKLASVTYKSSEVDELKRRIIELDMKRLRVMFKAFDEVQGIVGFGVDKDISIKNFVIKNSGLTV